MAKAPKPTNPNKDAGSTAFKMTVDGVEQRLHIADLGPKDARLVRKLKLGFSLAGMLSLMQDEAQVDIDVPCTLWWLARVKSGETKLPYEQAEDEFPSYEDFGDRVTIAVEEDDGDEDDPNG